MIVPYSAASCKPCRCLDFPLTLPHALHVHTPFPIPAFALTLCAVLLQSTKPKGGSYLITVEDLVMEGVYG